MKRPDGITVIAITDFFLGALVALTGCVFLAVMPAVIVAPGSGGGRLVGTSVLGILALAFLILGILPMLAGWGLLKLKEWARWITIGLAILALTAFPIGTAIGVVVIWYLLKPEVALAFGSGVPVVPQAIAPVTPAIPTVPPSPAPWSGPIAQPPAPNYPPQGTPPAPPER